MDSGSTVRPPADQTARSTRPAERDSALPSPTQLDLARTARGPRRRDAPRRVAMLSVHTSPLAQAGTGDAGGMNVYIVELARRLASAGVEVDIFTRATSGDQPPSVEAWPGVVVRHVPAGPYEGLAKEELPAQLCAFSRGVLRAEADRPRGWYDLIHSHYWLSGQVGALAKDRWGVPLVHSMHTMAKVKNAALAAGDHPEPRARVIGEEQVVDYADRLVANTEAEATQLRTLYDADPGGVAVVHPGVDLDVFRPGAAGDQAAARRRLGLPVDAEVLLFVGRIQPLKAPDVLVRAVARLLAARPELRERLVLAVVGGPSGSGLEAPGSLARLSRELGVAEVTRMVPPVPQHELADWYHAASVVGVPSYSESFGLVALEAQACGTPVVAAATGGLLTAVRDQTTGILVDGHGADAWAGALAELLVDPARRESYAAAGVEHARRFGWTATVDRLLEVYSDALLDRPEAMSG